jgi:putative membrane protein
MSTEERPASWARDHLANERTLLAWLRTALAFMAFGVALAKLGVLVRIATLDHPEMTAELPAGRISEAIGAGLVAFGGLVAILGTVRARRWARDIDPNGAPPQQRSLLGMGVLTTVIGLALLVYLLR